MCAIHFLRTINCFCWFLIISRMNSIMFQRAECQKKNNKTIYLEYRLSFPQTLLLQRGRIRDDTFIFNKTAVRRFN